ESAERTDDGEALRNAPFDDGGCRDAQQRDATIGALSLDERIAMRLDTEPGTTGPAGLVKEGGLRISATCIGDGKVWSARGSRRCASRDRDRGEAPIAHENVRGPDYFN